MTPAAAMRTTPDPLNVHVANVLDETAQLLEEQKANTFRVQAYRNAASTIRALGRGVDDVLDAEGLAGLDRLPGIGQTLARVIDQIVTTGRFPMLERLRGGTDPVAQLASVPGIGVKLARRPRDDHGNVDRPTITRPAEPPVTELLEIDREYREGSKAGTLPRIAPRRFNPTHAKWLPILHATREDTHYTALFSNTARAHERGMTHDWVVIYFERHGADGQRTVITATSGILEGRRVVRGRELECARLYNVAAVT